MIAFESNTPLLIRAIGLLCFCISIIDVVNLESYLHAKHYFYDGHFGGIKSILFVSVKSFNHYLVKIKRKLTRPSIRVLVTN